MELYNPSHCEVLLEGEGPEATSPWHVIPLEKQKNMPHPLGQGLARDEAMNHGQ